MTSSRKSGPCWPVRAGGEALLGEEQRQYGGALFALRAEESQVAAAARQVHRAAGGPPLTVGMTGRVKRGGGPRVRLRGQLTVTLRSGAVPSPARSRGT